MAFECCELREKILNAKSHIVVTGGPGCGKTTVALRKALWKIQRGLDVGQKVLFLSFSKAAVARIVEAAKSDLSKDDRKFLDIHTFHSFCWHIVRSHGYFLGAPNPITLLPPHEERTIRNGEKDETDEWLILREKLFLDEGKLVFDLFAPKALELLTKSKAIRSLVSAKYPLIIVDEAQDTGTEQWGCIEALSSSSQILGLADLDQQIYDFRKDVSPERLDQILTTLKPLEIDLAGENRRSPNCEVVKFGNDILSCTPRGGPYAGVYHYTFHPKAEERDRIIRQATGLIRKLVEQQTGVPPKSIGYLTSWGKGVAIIAQALQGGDNTSPIRHRVIMEDVEVLLASRVVALCLEPIANQWEALSAGLQLISEIYKAQGKIAEADKIMSYAVDALSSTIKPRVKLPKVFKELISQIANHSFSGIPRQDWIFIRKIFFMSGAKELENVSQLVIYLLGFNRGKRITDSLTSTWERHGCYKNARGLIESAIAQEQISDSTDSLDGINVMTMHKSKGKEFDCVIALHIGRVSPFSPDYETEPYMKSRRLLRVAITRARHCVMLLTDRFASPVLLKGHKLAHKK